MSTKDKLQVEIDLSDEDGASAIGDVLRLVASAIETEPYWDTTSAPIQRNGVPIGHWRILNA